MKKSYYLTSAIPYVNAKPHIGHALEFLHVDAIARYHKLLGQNVCTLTGSDENAIKNVQSAQKEGKDVQAFIDGNALLFKDLAQKLNVHFDIFQKGSNAKTHYVSSQKLWQLCTDKGDIYKKTYSGLYCVGCETFYTQDELNEQGECFEHPGKKLELVTEENYFFKLSSYQKKLIDLISSDKLSIIPLTRKNEILAFLQKPLQDISISRTNERAKNWGVPVPGDNKQRMYVWFDALNIYQSGIGFGWDDQLYKKWWPADLHVIGKGIIRFHAIYWPAFLMSAGLELPKQIMAHGYITINGQKMSKTIGNVIDPLAVIDKYGIDALRYYLLREIPTLGDGDYSENRMKELYQSDLVNELGNLIVRLTNMAEKDSLIGQENTYVFDVQFKELFDSYQLSNALSYVWTKIKHLNKSIDDFAPWKKSAEMRKDFLMDSLDQLRNIGFHLSPFLPITADLIAKHTQGQIVKAPIIFPRI